MPVCVALTPPPPAQGYSMRTATPFALRFTLWVRWNTSRPAWDDVYARELYNHTGPSSASPFRVLVCAARTLNVQYKRVPEYLSRYGTR